MNFHTLTFCVGFLLLIGCASVSNVEVNQAELRNYSCEQLQVEMVTVGAIGDDAENEQGMTGANVASAVFVPFGLQINQMRAEGAEEKAESALKVLYSVWDEKKCAEAIYNRNKATLK